MQHSTLKRAYFLISMYNSIVHDHLCDNTAANIWNSKFFRLYLENLKVLRPLRWNFWGIGDLYLGVVRRSVGWWYVYVNLKNFSPAFLVLEEHVYYMNMCAIEIFILFLWEGGCGSQCRNSMSTPCTFTCWICFSFYWVRHYFFFFVIEYRSSSPLFSFASFVFL